MFKIYLTPKFKLLYLIFLLFILLLPTGCSDWQTVSQKRSRDAVRLKEKIIIGVSWPLQIKELRFKEGLQMACDEINTAGGVLGKTISLIYEDDKNNVTDATLIAEKFAGNTQMTAIIGINNSYVGSQVAAIYEHFGLILFSPGIILTDLTNKNYRYFFRNIPSSRSIGRYLGNYVNKNKSKKVLVYYQENSYSKDLVNAFEDQAAALGIRVTYRESYEVENPLEYQREISLWSTFKFDTILLISDSFKEAKFIVYEIKKHYPNKPIITSYGLDEPNNFEFDPVFNDLKIATAYSYLETSVASQIFVKNFKKKYNMLPTKYAALAYDALKLIAYAISVAKTNDPVKLTKTIRTIKNWPGVTGSHTFNNQGDVINKKIILEIVKNSKLKLIQQ